MNTQTSLFASFDTAPVAGPTADHCGCKDCGRVLVVGEDCTVCAARVASRIIMQDRRVAAIWSSRRRNPNRNWKP